MMVFDTMCKILRKTTNSHTEVKKTTIFPCFRVENIALPRPNNGGTATSRVHYLHVRAKMEGSIQGKLSTDLPELVLVAVAWH